SKFNSHIYLTGGLENVEFAGESNIGLVVGTTYKVVSTDWLTWNFELKNHIFERDFLADKKMTNNIEFSVGFNVLF
ncbi:MAG: outer membrane beta-barrel domain-containing protein, partial [Kangiellaceae bacterium]|nr:outer membrane beta-barrel domain-containing protein [Kangiellaceae bacterium]